MLRGMPRMPSSSSSQLPVWMLNSSVREALVASVACTLPSVSRHKQVAVDGAEQELAALGARARARHMVEDPGDLGAGEIGIDDQPRFGRDRRLMPVGLEPCADVGGAAVLPDDGAMDRLAGGLVPHQRRLALVGDADRGDVGRGRACLAQRLAAGGDGRTSRCLRARARPSRMPENAAGIPAARWRQSRCRHETQSRAKTSCPDRSQGQMAWGISSAIGQCGGL